MDRLAWKTYAKRIIKAIVAIVVLAAVGRHVAKTWAEFQARGDSIHVRSGWIIVAGLLYLLGLAACGLFFANVMNASRSPVSNLASIRAYLISHLGKYVPGKAMVVVMRVGLVVPYGARPATAAIATFYETLVMMGAGAIVAVVGFALGAGPIQRLPLILSAGLALAFLVVVDPLVFLRVSKTLATPFPSVGVEAQPRIDRRLLGKGLLLNAISWLFLGLSQVAVIRALSVAELSVELVAIVTASVALATVAGFVVAVLPGGLGVREWVLMTTLAPALGEDLAVLSALALRLTWVAAEAVAALILGPLRPGIPEPASPALFPFDGVTEP